MLESCHYHDSYDDMDGYKRDRDQNDDDDDVIYDVHSFIHKLSIHIKNIHKNIHFTIHILIP